MSHGTLQNSFDIDRSHKRSRNRWLSHLSHPRVATSSRRVVISFLARHIASARAYTLTRPRRNRRRRRGPRRSSFLALYAILTPLFIGMNMIFAMESFLSFSVICALSEGERRRAAQGRAARGRAACLQRVHGVYAVPTTL